MRAQLQTIEFMLTYTCHVHIYVHTFQNLQDKTFHTPINTKIV